jgi:hypothetical protein
MIIYNNFYCPLLNLFGPEKHCEICAETIIIIPKHCIKQSDDKHWFPLKDSMKDDDEIRFTLDGERWLNYQINVII